MTFLQLDKHIIIRKYYFLLILFTIAATSDVSPDNHLEQDHKTAVNAHKDGGIVEKWLISGPLTRYTRDDSLQNDSLSSFNYDFLTSMGGESTAVIRTFSRIRADSAGARKYVRPLEVSADSNGIVSLDTLFTAEEGQVAYAFCLIEAFIPCSVRCLWGIDGEAKIWVNGKRTQNEWDCIDTCLPLSKYFDTEFIQGMNSVLIKLTDKRPHSRFTFEVWDSRDSLKPFQNTIRSLILDLDGNEITDNTDSLSAKLRFNIPVPEGVFRGEIQIYQEPGKLLLRKIVSSHTVDVGIPFKLGAPGDLQGVVCVNAVSVHSKDKKVQTQRYVWKGNIKASVDSQFARFERLDQDVKQTKKDNAFINTIIQGAFQWGKDWFTTVDSLQIDEKVRQLGYVRSNGDLIESLLRGERLKGDIAYPLYIHLDSSDEGAEEYDPSTWLNYRYPDTYALPKDVKGSTEYRFWMYLPSDAEKKNKKMPLILSLHDRGDCGYTINAIKKFGPGAYAETVTKFPFAVVTPQCRYNTLWDAKTLKKLLDLLIATGRFKKNRIYVTGVGMGAFASWYLPCKYPKYFAAALPINGGGDEETICSIKRTSIWAFHGARYRIVPIERSKNLITALKECGKRNVEFSIYTEHGHDLAPVIYGDPRIYKWLKKQRR